MEQIIIADKLCLCSGYQLDEMEQLSQSIFISEKEFWAPEQAMENIEKYSKRTEPNPQTLGFYSTGGWVRKMEDHLNQNFDAEEYVKLAVKEFCSLKPEYRLIIYLHPREYWDKYQATALDHYRELFKGINYEIAPKEARTAQCFEKADLAVALNTTVMYERLYYGFKSLLMPIGVENFPATKSNMQNICVYTIEDMVKKLEESVKLSNVGFFEKNGIRHFAKYIFN